MPTRPLRSADRKFIAALARRIKRIILEERGYSSLDAFALEFHELISKATLYEVCEGRRDMKISTILGLSKALGLPVHELMKSP